MIVKKQMTVSCMIVLCFVLLFGCSSANTSNISDQKDVAKGQDENKQPITLILYQHVLIPDDLYKELIEEPLKKKFPYITVKQYKKQLANPAEDINRLLTEGNSPDIIYTSSWHLGYFLDAKVPVDLSPYIKQSNYDLNRFEAKAVEAIKAYGQSGEMFAVPYTLNYAALFYNKDIFDKFGVPYPKVGLTWEDVIDLSKKVSRLEGGVQYKGFNPLDIGIVAESLSPPYFKPGTTTPNLVSDLWSRIFTAYDSITKIPGNEKAGWDQGKKDFAKDQVLAMLPVNIDYINELEDMRKQGLPLNWDVTSFPNYKEKPGVARATDVHNLVVSNTSKNKDVAFEVIAFLTEREQQLLAVQNGRPPSYKDPEIKKSFGSTIESIKDKHVQDIFINSPATPAPFSIYSDQAKAELISAASRVATKKQDINTALREAEERLSKYIEANPK